MKREIKFRAWVTPDGTFYKESKMIAPESLADMANDKTTAFPGYWCFKHLTFMQYTGLKDKNGGDIYEGDILERKYEDKQEPTGFGIVRVQVDFENGSFGWIGSFTGLHHAFDDSDTNYWQVIGNIYQNPELLAKPATTP